jgi:DNA-binding response OmpR family regulator
MPTPSERIAALEGQLQLERRRTALLYARLKHHECEPPMEVPEWAHRLAPGPAALMQALLLAYPHTRNRWQLDEMVPRRDHARERTDKVIDVYVNTVRGALGEGVIENDYGRGWRCSKAFHQQWGDPSRAVIR